MKRFVLFFAAAMVALLLPSLVLAQELTGSDFKTDYTDPTCMEAEMQYMMAGMMYEQAASYRDKQKAALIVLQAALAEASLSPEDTQAAQDYLDAAEADLVVYDMWLGLMSASLGEAETYLDGADTMYSNEDYETAYEAGLAARGLSYSVSDNIMEAGACSMGADSSMMSASAILLGMQPPLPMMPPPSTCPPPMMMPPSMMP